MFRSSTAAATPPASLTIAAGASSAAVSVATSQVSISVTAIITATYNGASDTGSFIIQPVTAPGVLSLTCSLTAVAGLDPSTCTITLPSAAPSGGASVAISDNSSVTSVPTSVTVPAGASSASFTVSTTAVTSNQVVTLTAASSGATQTATVTIVPAVPLSGVSCALPTAGGTRLWPTRPRRPAP